MLLHLHPQEIEATTENEVIAPIYDMSKRGQREIELLPLHLLGRFEVVLKKQRVCKLEVI